MHSGFIPRAAVIFISALWLGVLLGVSFLATPVKFQAQSLSLAVALDVGQVTFALLSKMEWALALLTGGCLLAARSGRQEVLIWLAAVAILAAQAFWLLPVLDVRLDAVIAGSPPPPSSHHVIYIAVEAAKAVLLFMLALAGFHRLAVGQQSFLESEPSTAAVGRR